MPEQMIPYFKISLPMGIKCLFFKCFSKNKILKLKSNLPTHCYISLIKEKNFCLFKTSVYFR